MVSRRHLVAPAFAAACSIPDVTFTGLDGGDGHVDRMVTARWSFKHLATGTQGSCPHPTDLAHVVMEPWDPVTQQSIDEPSVTGSFDCSAGQATVTLPGNTYLLLVGIGSATDQVLATSELKLVDATQSDRTVDVSFHDDAGVFSLAWDLVNKTTQARMSCATAGITANGSVEVVATSTTNPSFVRIDQFRCDDHFGSTAALPPGNYTVSVNAEEGGRAVGDAVTVTSQVIVVNDTTVLGTAKIKIP